MHNKYSSEAAHCSFHSVTSASSAGVYRVRGISARAETRPLTHLSQ